MPSLGLSSWTTDFPCPSSVHKLDFWVRSFTEYWLDWKHLKFWSYYWLSISVHLDSPAVTLSVSPCLSSLLLILKDLPVPPSQCTDSPYWIKDSLHEIYQAFIPLNKLPALSNAFFWDQFHTPWHFLPKKKKSWIANKCKEVPYTVRNSINLLWASIHHHSSWCG